MAKISKQTGLTKRQVEKTILALKTNGMIYRDGPDHGGSWIVNVNMKIETPGIN